MAAVSGVAAGAVALAANDPSRWAGARHPVTETLVLDDAAGACADAPSCAQTRTTDSAANCLMECLLVELTLQHTRQLTVAKGMPGLCSAVDPLDICAWDLITHNHDFEDPLLAQECGSADARGLD